MGVHKGYSGILEGVYGALQGLENEREHAKETARGCIGFRVILLVASRESNGMNELQS